MALVAGQTISAGGCVTRLNWVDARAPTLIETALGYEVGRLAEGYAIGLLAEPIRPNHVEFAGLTTRSGGRDGLPLPDPVQDAQRTRVFDRMVAEYGRTSVAEMLRKLADDPRNVVGEERIVKVFPVTRHLGENPAEEYPAGGGAPQYVLTEAHRFWIAITVSREAIATTAAGWSASVAASAPYDERAKIARYLRTTTV